jgi:D-alanine-D-alanine ligase-like ATP-grasp enzyme
MRSNMVACNYYSGPSVVGAYRSARWVFALSSDVPIEVDAICARAVELFAEVTGVTPPVRKTASATFADLALDMALALQRVHYHPVSRGAVRMLTARRFEVGVEVVKESIAMPLGECVIALLDEATGQAPDGTFKRVRHEHKDGLALTLTDVFLFDRLSVARLFGVPVWYDGARRQFFGDGANARLTSPGKTAATSRLGSDLSGDKQRTYHRLAACALPVPRQISVDDADAAVEAAQHIGYPVVLKPRWGKQGRGVTVNLLTEPDVRAAYAVAAEFGANAVVEQCISGADYRLLVIGGRFVAAVKRLPACVVGDGRSSVQALIDRSNQHDRRDGVFLFPIHVDPELRGTLASQGLRLDTVPPKGVTVLLRRVANQSLGGTTEDVTDEVHPDICAMAVAVAQACLLDLAGLDFMTDDIGRSWREGGAAIIEVNSGPGIDLHMLPTVGKPRNVSGHLIRSVRPAHAPGIVPRFMLLGQTRHALSVRLVLLLQRMGFSTGLLEAGRFSIGAREMTMDSPAQAAETLFSLPDVDAVVVEQAPFSLAESGSLVERYAVSVLSDADDDDTALNDLLCDSEAAERVGVLAVWLASVTVIDATSVTLRSRVAALPAQQVGYVLADDVPSAELEAHIAAGGWAVVCAQREEGAWLVWRQFNKCVPLLSLAGQDRDAIRTDAFVAAALIGVGLPVNSVARVLQGHILATAPTLAERARGARPRGWQPDELESVFDGAWINRPGPGWRINEVVMGVEATKPGAVVVIPGAADDLATCAAVAAAVVDAFTRGASAVVAPLVADDLPRWRPVLVCDDPAAGFARLQLNL